MIYATQEKAQAYFLGRTAASTWEAIPPLEQARLLQTASDAISLYIQSMGGLRSNADKEKLMFACCQEALSLSDTARQMRKALISQGVTATAIGGVSESYSGSAPPGQILQSPIAIRLLKHLVKGGGGVVIR